MAGLIRLQKILSEAGLCSRREAEIFIKARRVTLNGQIVSTLGVKADPETDHIKVDGKLIQGFEPKVVILLNKPKGYVTTRNDEKGRPTVLSLVKNVKQRVFSLGRLDFNTQGALLLSNDGELSRRLLLPSYKIPRVYAVKIQGIPDREKLNNLSGGVVLDGIKTAPIKIKIKKRLKSNCWLDITLFEGKNRQIHRMCGAIGHQVKELRRIRIAFLDCTGLKIGEFRYLTPKEITKLKGLVGL